MESLERGSADEGLLLEGPRGEWGQGLRRTGIECLELSGIEIWIVHPLITEIGVPVWLYIALTV